MAYYIFLKSLRSLEEFRKIPTSKFLLNLLVQIFKALVNSKIQLLLRKGFLFRFGSAARRCIWPFSPAGLTGYTRPSCSPSLPPAETSAATGPVSPRRASTARAPQPPPLSAPVLPLHLYSLAITTPSNRAITRHDELKITRPLNTTALPTITPPSPPQHPSPSPIKGSPAPMEHSHTIITSPPPVY
jgi:hypothetical protein